MKFNAKNINFGAKIHPCLYNKSEPFLYLIFNADEILR